MSFGIAPLSAIARGLAPVIITVAVAFVSIVIGELVDVYKRQDQACADAVMASEPLPNTELTDSAAKMEHNHEHLEGEQARDPFCITHPDTDWRACIAHAEKIGLGTSKYELVEVK